MANYVTFQIKIEGSNELKEVTVDAQQLGKAFDQVQAEVKGLKSEMVSVSSEINVWEGLSSAVGQLHGILSGLTSEYSAHVEAETRLATAMRNTMGASDAEIQSVRDLAAAQERIGIVSADVQLEAAQELATYLEFSDSLKTIIPVLNDMVAQQLSLGASAESATQIATMLGKVMNGQTEALSRYGYKFDDAQKYILQYGEESERAAVLAEVVEQSVAGMNEAMGQTDPGRMQQLANRIGDVKQTLGQAVQGAMPFISTLAEIAMAASGISQLAASFRVLGASAAFARVKTAALAVAHRTQAVAARILGVSELSAAAATGTLRAAVVALQATMTLGLAIALQAVIELLSRLFNRSNRAAEAVSGAASAQDAYKEAAAKARAETAADIVELEDLIKKKGQESDKVKELNEKYGEAFGTYSTAAQWYDTLTAKSKTYCEQLGYEALAAKYKDELADALKRQADAQERLDNAPETTMRTFSGTGGWSQTVTVTNPEWKKAKSDLKAASKEVEDIKSNMQAAVKTAADLAKELSAAGKEPAQSWKTMNLADLGKAITAQKALVESLAGGSDTAAAKAAADQLRQMQAREDSLQKAYGLATKDSTSPKDEYDGSKLIKNAESYKELGNNIKYYQNLLETTNPKEKEKIQLYTDEIARLKEKQDAIKSVMDAAGIPTELDSIEDITAAITYQKGVREKAKAGDIAAIDAVIADLEALRTTYETGFDPSKGIDQIKTYTQLDAALEYYNARLKAAAPEERAEILKNINALDELKKTWGESAADLKKPGEIGTLNSMELLDEAISYYQSKLERASASEVEGIQRTINALQAKRDMYGSIASLPEAETELSDLGRLSGKKLKIELEAIGIEGIRDRIRSLQKLLDDTRNPLDGSQRTQVESLISSYKSYEAVLRRSNATFADGWSDIKGIGGSVQSLTEALEGNGDAWTKVSAIIDAAVSVFQSLQGLVEIVKALTAASTAHAAAKQAEGAAVTAEAAQEAAAGAAVVATNTAVTATEHAKTTAQVADAASGAMAAHSGIPFVGIALGAAAVAAIVALMASLPKFAAGGLAYGPTLGLFGEYSGASSNPEVVAPLDRLKSLIGDAGYAGGDVRFRIEGRTLVGILEKESRYRSRM